MFTYLWDLLCRGRDDDRRHETGFHDKARMYLCRAGWRGDNVRRVQLIHHHILCARNLMTELLADMRNDLER
jgi:hypothetical protein